MRNTLKDLLNNYKLEGSELPIFTFPDSVLKKKGITIKDDEFNDELCELIKNMFYTMYLSPGIGLAAPQVGKSIRLFIMDIDYERNEYTRSDGAIDYKYENFKPRVYINPIISQKKGTLKSEEGCLSVPGVYEEVERADQIMLQYQDVDGKTHEEHIEGMESVCVQHENDHLDGIVFLDRLSYLKKNLIVKKLKKERKR
jgi:peptide deformylase